MNSSISSRSWYEKVGPPGSRGGVLPHMRYVVQQKGKVEIGIPCLRHVQYGRAFGRIDPKTRSGQLSFDAAFAENIETEAAAIADNRRLVESLYAKPWSSEFSSRLQSLDEKGLSILLSHRPAGVMSGIGSPLTLRWRFRT